MNFVELCEPCLRQALEDIARKLKEEYEVDEALDNLKNEIKVSIRNNLFYDVKDFPHALIDIVFPFFENHLKQLSSNVRCRKWSDKQIFKCVYFLQTHRTRDLKRYGITYSTVYSRINVWNKNNVFKNAIADMRSQYSEAQLSMDKSYFKVLITDTTLIKNIQGRDLIGKNSTDRGRSATKISAIVDSQQIPIAHTIHPANFSDILAGKETLRNLNIKLNSDKRVKNKLLGDKAYACLSTHPFNKQCASKGLELVARPRKNFKDQQFSRTKKTVLKANRHLIEVNFGRMKNSSPRFRLRYDHLSWTFEARFIVFNCFRIATYMSQG